MTNPAPRSTSLFLIALMLITGLALGWALNDARHGPLAAAPTQTAAATRMGAACCAPSQSAMSTQAGAATRTGAACCTPTIAPPTAIASPSAKPAPTAVPQITGYAGHVVAVGETLDRIAAAGGSSVQLITEYNRLTGEPAPGRALIVPRVEGAPATFANEPLMVQRGASNKPWVALTLDAGASSEPTGRMLDALRERGVRITFFLTGKWIAENPDLTRRIIAEGHELANHTYRHPDLTTLDDDGIRRELAETEAALHEIAPQATMRPFFRPPYGAYDERVQRVVQEAGYLPVHWTLDSLDSVGESKTAEFLLERVTGKLAPEQLRGAIILAHCGSSATADALPAILDRFAAMGFEVRPLSDVLEG